MGVQEVLGPIDKFFLLGGGRLFFEFAVWLFSQKAKVSIVIAERHANECIQGTEKTLKQHAVEAGIEFHVLNDINNLKEAAQVIDFTEKSLALSIGAAWIFKAETIKAVFHNRLFNLHGSRLPQNRGGGGFSWQILRGNRLGFCLIHRIDPGVDTGDIMAYEEFLYPSSCRIPQDYEDCYRVHNLVFLQNFLKDLFKRPVQFSPLPQPEYFSIYWPRLHTPTHAWIDWSLSIDMLDRFVCAFDDPYFGAQTMHEGAIIRLKKCLPDYNDGSFHPFQYGLIYRNNGKWLSIAANGGTLIVESAVDEKGNDLLMSLKAGERFYTSRDKLDNALDMRIYYTPKGFKAKR